MDPKLVIIMKSIVLLISFVVNHSNCLVGDLSEQRKVFEIKFIVPAGGRYCFSQFVSNGETLSFKYAVVQSKGDQNMTLGFTLMDEQNSNILISLEDRVGLYMDELTGGVEGGFELCFFNDMDRTNDKTVIFYMTSYKSHNWDNTDGELSELDVVAESFKRSFDNTEDQIEAAIKAILGFRFRESSDLALLKNTLRDVDLWSFTNCLLIGVVGLLQVYFVRVLFDRKPIIFQS